LRDLRDRALIATLTYSFARITAALKMKVEDLRPRGAGWTVRLHEKGGKEHAMPCHHALAEALRAYIDAAGIAEDRKGSLFRTARGHKADTLSARAMNQSDAWCMNPPPRQGGRHRGRVLDLKGALKTRVCGHPNPFFALTEMDRGMRG
jgi:integrase